MAKILVPKRNPVTDLQGVQFTTSGQSYYGPFGAETTLGTARVRFRVDAMPGTAFRIIAGTNNGGAASGWLLALEDPIGGQDVGQLVFYAGVGGFLNIMARKFLMPADIGRVFTAHLVSDGSTVFAYLDGKKVGRGFSGTVATATVPMLIGGRTDGTLTPAVTVIDVAEGTTALTSTQVAVDAVQSTPSFADQTHRYTAASSPGATWNDEVGSNNLTRVGSPTNVTFTPTFGRHRGCLEIYGDSIAAGRDTVDLGPGWKRTLQRLMSSTYGKAITLVGPLGADNLTGIRDFDNNMHAVGGEKIQTRITTLASDLTTAGANPMAGGGPVDCATLFAHGVNDIAANRVTAQIQADLTTAVGYTSSARPGRPIFVCNMLQTAVGALTDPQRAELATYQAAFASFITTLQATYPTVVGIDYSVVVPDPDAAGVYLDGTHPTPTTYDAMAAYMAPIIAGAM